MFIIKWLGFKPRWLPDRGEGYALSHEVKRRRDSLFSNQLLGDILSALTLPDWADEHGYQLPDSGFLSCFIRPDLQSWLSNWRDICNQRWRHCQHSQASSLLRFSRVKKSLKVTSGIFPFPRLKIISLKYFPNFVPGPRGDRDEISHGNVWRQLREGEGFNDAH